MRGVEEAQDYVAHEVWDARSLMTERVDALTALLDATIHDESAVLTDADAFRDSVPRLGQIFVAMEGVSMGRRCAGTARWSATRRAPTSATTETRSRATVATPMRSGVLRRRHRATRPRRGLRAHHGALQRRLRRLRRVRGSRGRVPRRAATTETTLRRRLLERLPARVLRRRHRATRYRRGV